MSLGDRVRADADSAAVLDQFLGWVAEHGLSPYPEQEEAILELLADRHVVLSTPTGSGKSLVALAMQFRALCAGDRSFYCAPVKALVSEKFFALCEQLGADRVGMLTGDASINPGAPVICCTTEVLANMALRGGETTDAPAVVLDEFHYYDPQPVPVDVGHDRQHRGDRGAARRVHPARGRPRALRRAPGAARLRVPRDAAARDARRSGGARPRSRLRRQLHPARVRRARAGCDQRKPRVARRARGDRRRDLGRALRHRLRPRREALPRPRRRHPPRGPLAEISAARGAARAAGSSARDLRHRHARRRRERADPHRRAEQAVEIRRREGRHPARARRASTTAGAWSARRPST
ncbi:MAG: DEAD/DEAH box helicase [Deltaproteobacteria bacterium]|nr:MAG: DEAD/DEAH box helicase [Deltaproteobacteria bacterium]